MKKTITNIVLCALVLALTGCPAPTKNRKSEDIQVGAYYSMTSVEGDYKVLKVLMIEDDILHFCYYNNVFKNRPSEGDISSLFFAQKRFDDMCVGINEGQQTTGRKHVALEIEGWSDLEPQFIVNDEVFSDELEAYEELKVNDRYNFPSGSTFTN